MSLTQLLTEAARKVHARARGRVLPTRDRQVSLPQRGQDMCKPLFSGEHLRRQFHDIKDEGFWRVLPEVHDFTQLSIETMWSLYEAVRHIVGKGVKGDVVECGVFFGGASMLVARTLLALNETARELYLYDSFQGFIGQQAHDDRTWYGDSIQARIPDFDAITTDNVRSTGYPVDKIRIIKGDIEVTAKANSNGPIALLRLDTDTYHSTKAELEHFYPKLVPGGILIVDDYGHAFGARRATDEYFADPAHRVLLHRVNFTNRIGVKL